MSCRVLDEKETGPSTPRKKGRKLLISEEIINESKLIAEANDLKKDSASSSQTFLDNVDRLRRLKHEKMDMNVFSKPANLSRSTEQRALRKIVPVRLKGGLQNTSRQRALLAPHNAISCAATWTAVAEGIDDPRQIHSWDELSIELNGFGRKAQLLLTESGAAKLKKRNLCPSATRNQGKEEPSRSASVS